ncbi:hypothetical protein PRIPAC_76762 [Pristionchus pacificus]|uniref:G protein-coupled receptor n=1 Tax=Pristionchus pacificus TaxID=54126 RepID=A0A2A6CMX5_PRIPA|nr:hypothetical protein PRIPAC_76762 [Pristionchus pacificus]|eukprot:PDM79552.1 G protein-coupled receptor [Pristionchus pacificus]
MKSGVVHRNFRLQLCTSAVYYSLGVLGRCVLFYAQYTGGSDDDKYSLDYMFAHTLCIAIAGFIAFGSVYSKNLKMLNRIKCGAQVGSYSVARTFQVKENVEVLRV